MPISPEGKSGVESTIIIGDTSLTGKAQLASMKDVKNTLGTSRAAINMIIDIGGKRIEVKEAPGLGLDNKTDIETRVAELIEQYSGRFLFSDEVQVFFHAMAITGIDRDYPNKVIAGIQKKTKAKVKAVIISYEGDSHVNYGARNSKNQLEGSLERSNADDKLILDLIVFDSPSAKPLGPTFVGVVGDFISFLHHIPESSKSITNTLKEVLGNSYTSVQDFLSRFPIRGELQSGQQSMKLLAAEGKFQDIFNEWTKKIDFGRLSFVSPLISTFYLELVGEYLESQKETLNARSQPGKPGRLLLSWDEVTKNIKKEVLEEKFRNLAKKIKDSFEPEDTSEIYKITQTGANTVICTFNPKFLNIIDEHFGITPLMLQEDILLKSGLLKSGEYVKTRKASSQIYTGDPIKVERQDANILFVNAKNPREVFTTMQVGNIQDVQIEEKKGISLPEENLQDEKVIEDIAKQTPHRLDWVRTHLNGVISSYKGAHITPEATILENIGFRLGNLLIRHKNFIEEVFGVTEEKLKGLQGKFLEINTLKPLEDIEEIVSSGEALDIKITGFKKSPVRVTIEVQIVRKGKIIGSYEIIGI